MTLRAIGIPELVDILRHPAIANREVRIAADLADVLEWSTQQRWPQAHFSAARPTPGSPEPRRDG